MCNILGYFIFEENHMEFRFFIEHEQAILSLFHSLKRLEYLLDFKMNFSKLQCLILLLYLCTMYSAFLPYSKPTNFFVLFKLVLKKIFLIACDFFTRCSPKIILGRENFKK